jgi:hypothetical protein
LGLASVCTAALIAGWTYSLVLLGILALYTLPGLSWAFAWCGRPSLANPVSVVVGFSLGIAVSLLLIGIAVRFFGWTTWAVVLPPVIASVPGWLYLRFLAPTEPREQRGPALDTADYVFFVAVCFLLLGLLAVPFLRVGHVVGGDHQFHSLFAFDYLVRNAVGFSALGGLPPRSVYVAGQPNSGYYYLYYTLYASVLHVADQGLLPHDKVQPAYQLLGASSIYLTVLFVFALFLNVKAILPSRFAGYAAVACSLFAYSYYGFYVLVKRILAPAVPALGQFLSSRGLLTFSDISKGWYRDFLVEPQAVLALILFFTCFLLLVPLRRGAVSPFMAIGVGIMLAGSFSSDSAIGTIGVLWFGVFLAWQWLRGEGGGRWRVFAAGLFGFAAAAVALVAAQFSGLAPAASGSSGTASVSLWLNKMIFGLGVVYLPLDYGPPLLLAIAGLFLICRRRPQWSKESSAVFAVIALAAICLAFAACLKYGDAEADVASVCMRKAGKVLRFPLLIASGWYFCFLSVRPRDSFLVKYPRVVLAVVLLGVPALAIDCAVFSGMYDDGQTGRVSCADYDACEWLRANTPLDAVVQSLPQYDEGYHDMTPLADIGGRTLAMGRTMIAQQICKANSLDFERLKRDTYSLFEPATCEDAERVLREYSIAYVYVGSHERAWRPGGTDKYYATPQLFQKVYSCNGVDIFLYRNNTKGYTAAL